MRHKISAHHTVRGLAFPDYIRTDEHTRHRRSFDQTGPGGFRVLLLLIFLFGLLLFLVGRILFLTLFQGNYYLSVANNNRLRTTIIHAPRGIIFDRFGVPLVFNIPGYRHVVSGKTITLTREEAVALVAKKEKNLEIDSLRSYPYKDAFAHALGYIGQITEKQLKDPSYAQYQSGGLIGQEGLEQQYESLLRGIDGKQLVEVDAVGNTVRKLGQTDPLPGENITTTLDANLERAAASAMENIKKGSVIVTTPTGEVLVLLSKPSFDPNLFTLGKTYKTATTSGYQRLSEILLDGENQPLLNRAISGTYPPGSTFKLITAAAGLNTRVIDEKYQMEDTGIVHEGAFSFANWYYTQYGKTEGNINIVGAIKRSNDIFFYKLAQKVGVDTLSEVAKSFGIGQRLGIDLSGEASGLVPTSEWKQNVMHEQWYLGDTYHYGIGQGYLLTTPLQVNVWTQILANGGKLYRPRLVNGSNNPFIKDVSLSQEARTLIRQGMIASCSPGGVAWPLFDYKVKNARLRIDGKNILEAPQATTSAGFKDYRHVVVACKTGTSQHGGDEALPHSWITLYAPAYDPQIIVTVLAESSGEGSNVAGPIAKKILDEWFSR